MKLVRAALAIGILGLLGLGLANSFGVIDQSLFGERAGQWMIAVGLLLLAGFAFQILGMKSNSAGDESQSDSQKTEKPPIL